MKSTMKREARAPSSVAKNMPGFPSMKKKSRKFMSAAPPRRMDVVSPTRVAAPCRLDETAMLMMTGIGEIPSLLHIARPIGATMRTVATLSTKADMTPAKSVSMATAHMVFGTCFIIISDIRRGILLSMNRVTVPMVPAIMSRTLKSMAPNADAKPMSHMPSRPRTR